MNMKNTVILLIFLLSIMGLIMGVYCTEGVDSDGSQKYDSDVVVLDEDSIITITDNEDNVIANILT
jgi:hypothetical protein